MLCWTRFSFPDLIQTKVIITFQQATILSPANNPGFTVFDGMKSRYCQLGRKSKDMSHQACGNVPLLKTKTQPYKLQLGCMDVFLI